MARSEKAGSTSHDYVIKKYVGPRGKPEATEEVQGRAQQALKETRSDEGCVHWDQTKDSQPADSANYRRKGTSGAAFIEGSGSLARNPKRANRLRGVDAPSVQWEDTEENHPYRKYDHSKSRKPDAHDPVPQPAGQYFERVKDSTALTSTRLNRDSDGRLSTPNAGTWHNKDEKTRGINPGDRAEHTAAATDPKRRETATGFPEIPEAEQKERGTAGSDALLKQLGSNGYQR